jgi:serine/threonine protein kinase
MMDHPNIARVFDGGATEEGRPYLVMELVDGPAITHYCDARALTLSDRLDLFVRVCQAVQHAHHKGVIHRDLKPSNILVAEIEARPFPKIIDFGVAKATQEPFTDNLLLTQFHQVLGTPAYMSPEQTGLGGLDIDARADVYALGVLLYELLTGETPLASRVRPDAGREELLRVIRDVEPTRPSARLRSMAPDDLRRISKCRDERPDRLPRLVEGDLDGIALKALEKDRDRRYPSASALAEDVLRHLAGEPVAARPPATLYRFGKWIGRHRLGFAAASTVLAALIIGLVVALAQAIRAARAEENIRHRAYAAEVNLAQQVLRENNLERALELLNRQTPGRERPTSAVSNGGISGNNVRARSPSPFLTETWKRWPIRRTASSSPPPAPTF